MNSNSANSKILKNKIGDLIGQESLLDKEYRILKVLILYDAVTEKAFRKGYRSPDDFIIRPAKLSDLPKVPDDFMTCQTIVQTCYKKFNPEGEPQISFREARKIVYCYKAIKQAYSDGRLSNESGTRYKTVSLIMQCMQDTVSFCNEYGCQPFEDHSDAVEHKIMKECQ